MKPGSLPHSENRRTARTETTRHGSILLAVLVVIALLSLGAYTFTEVMVSEAEGTAMFARRVQARYLADSGVDLVCAVLASGTSDVDLYDNPELFQNQLVVDSERLRGQGYFSVVAPVVSDTSGRSIRFGLVDESAKLNLNTLLSNESSDPEEVRQRLLYLPNMTEDVADAILDWLDEDDEPRELGAEAEYYLSLVPSYEPANGPFRSLDELLLVAGVTPELLYGEDWNRNGLLDPNEDDGDASPPLDDADGQLDLGWVDYLTVYSRESNRRSDGSQKINLNESDLESLYDQVAAEFGEDAARFVVAYRIYGPAQTGESTGEGEGEVSDEARQQAEELGRQIGQALAGGGGGTQKATRGGLDLSRGGSHKIQSVFDLVGVQVNAEVDGQPTQLTSPWSDDPNEMQGYLPQLLDAFTTTDDEFIEGRINVNEASWEVLMTVPGMTEELADAIVGLRGGASEQGGTEDTAGTRTTVGWLYVEGLVTLDQLRKLAPYITTRGSVFRVQVVGYFGEGGPFVREEAVVDASELPPKILALRDLNNLGKGYSRSLLQGGTP